MKAFREFWYNNVPGTFDVAGHAITRGQIHTYGGPATLFAQCNVCEEAEWLSRLLQKNLFRPHTCPTSNTCRTLCGRQGDDLWTHYHQNFWYSVGIDETLDAPKCLCLFRKERKGNLLVRFGRWECDSALINVRRQLAQTCQLKIVSSVKNINLQDYDFIYTMNSGVVGNFVEIPEERKKRIPIVMYAHDMWKFDYQGVLDCVRPDILLTPFPTSWRKNFKIPAGTKLWFYPLFATRFFTRPNLSTRKEIDLLSIGNVKGKFYTARVVLDKQLRRLPKKFKVVYSHNVGCRRAKWNGPASSIQGGMPVHYLNKWSEFLGSAHFVVFGPCIEGAKDMLLMKYYECLGSGAVPILPVVPDFKRLGLQPMVHYIPLSRVWGDNGVLSKILSRQQDYRHIAKAAVKWYFDNADELMFRRFDDLIQTVTGGRYPRRLY